MSSSAAHFPGVFGTATTSTREETYASKSSSTEVARLEGSRRLSVPSDEALMASVCKGDTEALALLFRRYARIVRGVACRVLRDASEADDLLQDIFVLVHRLCETFDSSKGSARFWILQMTYRRAISRRRYLTSRHFYTMLDLDHAATQLADPRPYAGEVEESIDGRIGRGNLKKVFEKLSENQQQTLRLFFVEGYTFDEIAEKLGQSRGNVKNHYFRGLDRLRKRIFASKLGRTESSMIKDFVHPRSRGVVSKRTP
jgi:RNA polymerase sigma-70 factor (ECF subfamily)